MGVISGLILTGSACCRVCIFYEKQYVIVFMFLINEKRTRHGVVKSLNRNCWTDFSKPWFLFSGRFTDLVARWPGATHDAHIFRNSSLKTRLERHHGLQDGILLGDSGYACKPYLLTPYLRPSTREQENYNGAHKRTRTQIERAFGWLKRRFSVLHGEIRMHPERVCTIIGKDLA